MPYRAAQAVVAGAPLALGEKTAIFAVSVAIMVGIGVTVIAAIVGAFASFCGVIAIGGG